MFEVKNLEKWLIVNTILRDESISYSLKDIESRSTALKLIRCDWEKIEKIAKGSYQDATNNTEKN